MALASELFIHTLKETPAEAEIDSHQLMLRAGLIQQISMGIYSWMPLGLRVIRKIENIVRQEMQAIGCQEVLMPGVQPAELWHKSGRWKDYGKELLRLTDRHNREYCLGPTHEEVITTLVKNKIQSYQELPICLFQIQTKFRDEIRPRFGVMRAREFIMKDAYSFDVNAKELQKTYEAMETAYNRIFTRMGVNYRVVRADSGAIGGDVSREFHVLTPNGEDELVISSASDYAANIELAECPPPQIPQKPKEQLCELSTPGCTTIKQLAQAAKVDEDNCLKLIVVHHAKSKPKSPRLVALALRGGDQLNEVKVSRLPEVATPLKMAGKQELEELGLPIGYIGPVKLPVEVIADNHAASMSDFVCGANKSQMHLGGVNWGRDASYIKTADMRNIRKGEICADGRGKAIIQRGTEVGHIFQLGDKYSKSMGLKVVNKEGAMVAPLMGCYGIGVSRIVAALIEQQHDSNGIIWNHGIAPYLVHLLPLSQSNQVIEATEKLVKKFGKFGIEPLVENRKLRPGVMFSQADLLGIPWHLVISDRNLANDKIEVKWRATGEKQLLDIKQTVELVKKSRK